MKNGVFEKPPIAIRLPDGLSILDGNHRISAFCGLQETPAELLESRGLKKPDCRGKDLSTVSRRGKPRRWSGEY
jgi:hypothetical protein